MGFLHTGIPLPSLFPKGWSIIMIDLNHYNRPLNKYNLFLLCLLEQDREKDAFRVPFPQPIKRSQWKILRQGMLNSSTLSQHFV